MKSQDVFSPNRQTETFVLYNCSRKASDIQGFFPCCEQHFHCVAINIPFLAVSPIQYTEGSHRAVEVTLGGFLLPEKRKGGLCYGTQNHAEAADKNQRPCAQSLL